MRLSLRLEVRDYNGELGSTGISLMGGDAFNGISPILAGYEAVLDGLTDGFILRGTLTGKIPTSLPPRAPRVSSAYDRLFLFCTNGSRYGSFSIPAPALPPLVQTGVFRGYKVAKNDSTFNTNVEALLALLAQTSLPDGTPFPNSTLWEACLNYIT